MLILDHKHCLEVILEFSEQILPSKDEPNLLPLKNVKKKKDKNFQMSYIREVQVFDR